MKYGSKALTLLIVFGMALTFAMPAWAEFYRYEDQHGNVMYTDDLSKVPVDQRAKAQYYEESRSTPQPAVTQKEAAENAQPAGTDEELENERRRLQDQEKTLNQEYEDLMDMRTQLNAEKGKAVTSAQIKAYNQQIIDFNQRIQAYEQKRDTLAAEVKAFNQKVDERTDGEPKQD